MFLHRSNWIYASSPAKQAVVDRFNAILNNNSGMEVDWAFLLAELIDAYNNPKAKDITDA